MNQYGFQSEVNLSQPPQTHNAQTIIDLKNISFSKHRLSTNLDYIKMIFRHEVLIKKSKLI